MQISWKWLGEWLDTSTFARGAEEAAELLTKRGLEVEEILRLDQGFEKVVSARILERAQHPQADRLSLCKVTTGENQVFDIVCGAQNMKAGDTVMLAQVGALLPNGLKIAESKIRGSLSQGMLCSEEELGLAKESEGILILPESTALGIPAAQLLGRDDVILVLKVTANRGDCQSHLGIARELAAAKGLPLKRPKALSVQELAQSPGSQIRISLDAGSAAPQFWGALIDGVKIGPSPEWLRKKLESVGSRSINNVVDATNLVLLELGQPVHAYDADLLKGGKISVRDARADEELPLLDGTSIQLTGGELVIADGERAVGLAGVMGGGNSEVSEKTKRVFLEVAEFDPIKVRRASTSHQKRTDAAHRFERGVDPSGVPHAMARLISLVLDLAGGKIIETSVALAEDRKGVAAPDWRPRPSIPFAKDFVSRFVGLSVTETEIVDALRAEGCVLQDLGTSWSVVAPSHRSDLRIAEDLAEEVARSVGYDRIPSTVPPLTSAPVRSDRAGGAVWMKRLQAVKTAFVDAGLNETLSYSFASQQWIKEVGFQPQVKLLNPLSEAFEWMVPSLLPGMVQAVLENERHHFGSEALPIRLFEVRPAFFAPQGVDAGAPIASSADLETGVRESWRMAFALSGPRFAAGIDRERGEVDYLDVKSVVERVFDEIGVRGVRWTPLSANSKAPESWKTLFHPGQTAELWVGNRCAGVVGLLHPLKAKQWKVRSPLWLAELEWDVLAPQMPGLRDSRSYKAWPEFPSMERDFALLVKKGTPAEKVMQVALKAAKPLAKTARVFDIYEGSQVPQGMTSIALRVTFYEESRSLQENETEAASQKVIEAFRKELGAELR